MAARRTRWGALLAAPLLVGTLAACDPPPPVPVFHVDATEEVSDVTPGDGVCATEEGTCTLQAAVEEADALGRGEVVVPPGEYEAHAEVSGSEVTVRADTSGDPRAFATVVGGFGIGGAFGSEGGTLALRDIEVVGIVLIDGGTFAGDRISIGGGGGPSLSIGGGSVVLRNSFVSGIAVWGRLTALSSTIGNGGRARVLEVEDGASVALGGSAIITGPGQPGCSVAATAQVTSLGSSYAPDSSCGLAGPGDVIGGDDDELYPSPGSPRIDAVPAGTFGCGSTLVSDIRGYPRPVDGDDDGNAACDIGAWEHGPVEP